MPFLIRCSQCGTEQPMRDEHGAMVPASWIAITEYQPGATPNDHHHVCSRLCGALLLSKPIAVEPPAVEPPTTTASLVDPEIPF